MTDSPEGNFGITTRHLILQTILGAAAAVRLR